MSASVKAVTLVPEDEPRPRPGSSERARRALARHCDHQSGFLALNTGTQHYFASDIDGMIPYTPVGRNLVAIHGGVYAPEGSKEELLRRFMEEMGEQGRKASAVQLTKRDAALFAALGFTVNQFGASYSIELSRFSLRGRKFVKVRNMISRARREGVSVSCPAPGEDTQRLSAAIERIDRQWLRRKGRFTKELRFMVGEWSPRTAVFQRTFLGTHRGEVVAYVLFSPVYGERPGWLYNLVRTADGAPKGTIDLILADAIEQLGEEGAAWMHLGFTPFVDMHEEEEIDGCYNRTMQRSFNFCREHAAMVYPAISQRAFKMKWRPHAVDPEYIAFERPGPLSLLRLSRHMNAI